MTLRHAAALTILGWYLMVPPSMRETNWDCSAGLVSTLSHKFFGTGDEKQCVALAKIADMNAPLSAWHEASPFETLDACQEAQIKLANAARPGEPDYGARCVASDDPRLKP